MQDRDMHASLMEQFVHTTRLPTTCNEFLDLLLQSLYSACTNVAEVCTPALRYWSASSLRMSSHVASPAATCISEIGSCDALCRIKLCLKLTSARITVRRHVRRNQI